MRCITSMQVRYRTFSRFGDLALSRVPEAGEHLSLAGPDDLFEVVRAFKRSDGLPVIEVAPAVGISEAWLAEAGFERCLPEELPVPAPPRATSDVLALIEYRPSYVWPGDTGPQFARRLGQMPVPRIGERVELVAGVTRPVHAVRWHDVQHGRVTVELRPIGDRDTAFNPHVLLVAGWQLRPSQGRGVQAVREREGWPAAVE